jgi:hypothetical protein
MRLARVAGLAAAGALVVAAAGASAQGDAPITIAVPKGVTSVNFPNRLEPRVTCQAVHCRFKLSAKLTAAQLSFFGIHGAHKGVIGEMFEEEELGQGETSDPLTLFTTSFMPQYQPVSDITRELPTKPSVPTTLSARVVATDAGGNDHSSTVSIPIALKWPKGKPPSGKGKKGLVRRVVVPKKVSLRAKRVKVRVLVASSVHSGILQSAMLGPGGVTGFLGKFEIRHGGWYTIPMSVSNQSRMVRKARPLVPTTGQVTAFVSTNRRTDQAARWFRFVR